MDKTLAFWTVGLPLSVDAVGFLARSKLRFYTVNKQQAFTTIPKGSKVWLLIEPIYSDDYDWVILHDYLPELKKWFFEHCFKQGWMPQGMMTKNCTGNPYFSSPIVEQNPPFDYSKYYCPSAEAGYQDTWTKAGIIPFSHRFEYVSKTLLV
jgi:hypothetical protein